MIHTYRCRAGEEITSDRPADVITCPEHGTEARRIRSFSIGTSQSRRDEGRYDPTVGRYVKNHADFLSALHEGQARVAAEMNTRLDVRAEVVDARDTEALCELHHMTQAERDEQLEPTRRREHDKAHG